MLLFASLQNNLKSGSKSPQAAFRSIFRSIFIRRPGRVQHIDEALLRSACLTSPFWLPGRDLEMADVEKMKVRLVRVGRRGGTGVLRGRMHIEFSV